MEAYFWKGNQWIHAHKGLDIHRYGFVAELRLKRQSEYYITNLCVPLFVVVLTGFLVVLVPSDSNNRIDLSVSVLLGFTFVQTIISALLPKTDQIPLLAKYVVSVLLLSVVSVASNVLVFALSTRPPHERPPLPLVPLSVDLVVALRITRTFLSSRVHRLVRSSRTKLPQWWAYTCHKLHSGWNRARIGLMQRFGFLWEYLYFDSSGNNANTSPATTPSSPFHVSTRTGINTKQSDVGLEHVASFKEEEANSCSGRCTFRFQLLTACANGTSLDRFLRTHFGRRHSVPSVSASTTSVSAQQSDRSTKLNSEKSAAVVSSENPEVSWRQLIRNLNTLFTSIYLCAHALVFLRYFEPLLEHWFALAIDRGNWWEGQ